MKSTLTADKIIDERQVKLLLKETGREKDNSVATGKNLKYLNDYFSIGIAYNTGLRISELVAVKWQDIQKEFLIVRCGKGGKSRTIYYGERTYNLFEEFKKLQSELLKRPCAENDFVFIGQRGALKRCAVHLRFKYWINRLGLPKTLSFHSLRHGFATRLLDNSVPLQAVKEQLGHSNISVTSTYLHFTTEAKEKIEQLL